MPADAYTQVSDNSLKTLLGIETDIQIELVQNFDGDNSLKTLLGIETRHQLGTHQKQECDNSLKTLLGNLD